MLIGPEEQEVEGTLVRDMHSRRWEENSLQRFKAHNTGEVFKSLVSGACLDVLPKKRENYCISYISQESTSGRPLPILEKTFYTWENCSDPFTGDIKGCKSE